MNRRFFMRALATGLGVFGLGHLVKADETKKREIFTPYGKQLYKYTKFLRRCDQATMDEFNNVVFIDDLGGDHKVPIIRATDDKTESYLARPIPGGYTEAKFPLMNIYRGDIFFNEKICAYYHLSIRGLYEDHMNQILEQAIVKFHPKFKNSVGEYHLMSMINNYYPGGSVSCSDTAMRGDLYSAAKWGKQGEWVSHKEDSPINVLRHQLNMIVTMEGKP